MKIRTVNQLVDSLDSDFSWRLQEIAQLRRASLDKGSLTSRSFQRASIPIIYAHWEGFIKNGACLYANHVALQVTSAQELERCFLGIIVKSKIDQIYESKRGFKLWHESVLHIEAAINEKPNLNLRGRIDRVGNLDFSTFSEIVHVCGLSITPYETKQKFINEVIIKSRNEVAHGEHTLPSAEIEQMFDVCIELLRSFKTDLENAATMKSYLRKTKL